MWHAKFEHCTRCEQVDSPFMAKGLCRRCYLAEYRSNKENRERIAQSKKEWYLANHVEQLRKRKVDRERKHFDGKREEVIRDQKGLCFDCGKKRTLTVHHINERGRGCAEPDNKRSNLVGLCRACHLERHRPAYIAARMAKFDKPKLGKGGRWSQKHDHCIRCEKQTSKHAAKGLCTRCYQQQTQDDMV
jgi:5-methylcytosine-specific restriction endonuclease McrA